MKYKTSRWTFDQLIEPVEIDRETKASVWVNGNRRAKFTDFDQYHNTWEEAKAYLMKKAEQKVASARHNLNQANGFLGNVKGLKNPNTHL